MPEVRGAIWYEHWHRYCAVGGAASGKRVLDAACGEGYGSFLLARQAVHVTGVDLGEATIAHARARYSAANLAFACASVTALPLPSSSVDLIVSFETIEHLAEQAAMLAEFRRVLVPAGVLIISSPNRPVYNLEGAMENAFHIKELDRADLAAALRADFPSQRWYAQRVMAHSVLWREGTIEGAIAFDRLRDDRAQRGHEPAAPMYFVVVCGADDVDLPGLSDVSLFDDGALSLWNDYARAIAREKQLAWDELDARKVAEDRLAELIDTTNALASERQRSDVRQSRVHALETELAREQGAHTQTRATLAQMEERVAHETAAHEDTRARLAYRETAVGWMRWPLGAMRRRLGLSRPE